MENRISYIEPDCYQLSSDQRGLMAHATNASGQPFSYHVHSGELAVEQAQVHAVLLQNERAFER